MGEILRRTLLCVRLSQVLFLTVQYLLFHLKFSWIISPLQDFVMGLSILLRGTIQEKLNWAFNLYDINKDGYITKEVCLCKQHQHWDVKWCSQITLYILSLVIYCNADRFWFNFQKFWDSESDSEIFCPLLLTLLELTGNSCGACSTKMTFKPDFVVYRHASRGCTQAQLHFELNVNVLILIMTMLTFWCKYHACLLYFQM